MAEYDVDQQIDHEPASVWWFPFTLRKRNRIIAAGNYQKHQNQQFKYGFNIPKDLADAYAIDKDNSNTLWAESAVKEMTAVQVAFNIIVDSDMIPPGYTEVTKNHLIFDIDVEDLRRKTRYFAAGNTIDSNVSLTYASVVSQETVRIALTKEALNDL